MDTLSASSAKSTRWIVLVSGFVTSLFIWPTLIDPLQQPKLLLLLLPAGWLLVTIVFFLLKSTVKQLSYLHGLYILFALGLIIDAFFTDLTYTAFFGEFLRSMGALSYLSLAIVGLAAMISFDLTQIKDLQKVLLILGFLLSIYGLLQLWGHDPAMLRSSFSPIVGTLGNPDFISGLLGALAISAFWAFISFSKLSSRIAISALFLLELFVIKKSGSSQGFLVVPIGISFLTTALLWKKKKPLGQALLITFAALSVPVFLGLMNMGPLASRIYRATLLNRFDYWHAAINMGKGHLLTGVGLERFGDSYFQYAPTIRIVQTQRTDNAHNLFLQFFATGGLVLLIPYILLIVSIAWASVRIVPKLAGPARIDFLAIFSMWLGLLLLSFISIDNLGQTIWFWIFGGILAGAASKRETSTDTILKESIKRPKPKTVKKVKVKSNLFSQPRISACIISILTLFIVVPPLQISSQLDDLQHNKSKLDRAGYLAKIEEISQNRLINTQSLIVLAGFATTIEEYDLAISISKQILAMTPRSFQANFLGAQASESSKNIQEAIIFRQNWAEIDPANPTNLLALVKDHLSDNNQSKARKIVNHIEKIFPGSDVAKTAASLILG